MVNTIFPIVMCRRFVYYIIFYIFLYLKIFL